MRSIIIHKQRSYNGAFCIAEYNFLDLVWTQEVLYKKFQTSKFHHLTCISENAAYSVQADIFKCLEWINYKQYKLIPHCCG